MWEGGEGEGTGWEDSVSSRVESEGVPGAAEASRLLGSMSPSLCMSFLHTASGSQGHLHQTHNDGLTMWGWQWWGDCSGGQGDGKGWEVTLVTMRMAVVVVDMV